MAQPKSKIDHSMTLYGTLGLSDVTITELVDDREIVYNLLEKLADFNGKEVTISIKEKQSLATPPVK